MVSWHHIHLSSQVSRRSLCCCNYSRLFLFSLPTIKVPLQRASCEMVTRNVEEQLPAQLRLLRRCHFFKVDRFFILIINASKITPAWMMCENIKASRTQLQLRLIFLHSPSHKHHKLVSFLIDSIHTFVKIFSKNNLEFHFHSTSCGQITYFSSRTCSSKARSCSKSFEVVTIKGRTSIPRSRWRYSHAVTCSIRSNTCNKGNRRTFSAIIQ